MKTSVLTFGGWLLSHPKDRVMDGDWDTWTAQELFEECLAEDPAYLETPCVMERGVLVADVPWDRFAELCEAGTLVIMVAGKSSKRDAKARLAQVQEAIQHRSEAGTPSPTMDR